MRFKTLNIIFILCILSSCGGTNNGDSVAIIPAPNKIAIIKADGFVISDKTVITFDVKDKELLQFIAMDLVSFVDQLTGFTLDVQIDIVSDDNVINLSLNSEPKGSKAYQLMINSQVLNLSADNPQALFYAVQSLKQLIFNNSKNMSIPALEIIDQPRFEHRGLMLDVSRHFFSVDEIKRLLDTMALYKLNTFHWHLTDDQGWRIEIKQYPLLTDVGSYRHETMVDKNFDPFIGDGIPHSGFYSQNDIIDVVNYARERFITVIPEIDFPGHMQSAIAAYPELACSNGPFEVSTRWGIHSNVLCPSDFTFEFLENVLTEVISLFPSKKIHLGGDEVPIWRWQQSEQAQQFIVDHSLVNESGLHGYFFQYMANFLAKSNRQAIGWDDLIDKGITNVATGDLDHVEPINVMVWQDIEQAKIAAQQNYNVIMSPSEFTYLNYYQGNQQTEPLAQCCSLPISKVYQFRPIPAGLSITEQQNIIGLQANVWTEYIKTPQHLDYMLMPRLMAIAEVAWTEENNISWQSFEKRYQQHFMLLDFLDVGFRDNN